MQSADCRCNCKIESWCLPTAVLQWPHCDCCQRCHYPTHSTSWPISSARRCLWPASSCSSQHNIQHHAPVQAHVRLPALLTQCVLRDSAAPRVCGRARHIFHNLLASHPSAAVTTITFVLMRAHASLRQLPLKVSAICSAHLAACIQCKLHISTKVNGFHHIRW